MEEEKLVFEGNTNKDSEVLISPYQYFQSVKDKIQEINNEKLLEIYNNTVGLAENYSRTGQTKGLKKLIFHMKSIMKEQQVINAGITKFVYRDDIEEYIQNVASKQVVIIDLENYERAIPEEVIQAMESVKDLFDKFYVVCTDYNGRLSKQVQKERREKDPILFGVFIDKDVEAINERFYYIGDWVDAYCDLTLDKLVSEVKAAKDKNILYNMSIKNIPKTQEELQEQIDSLYYSEEENDDGTIYVTLKKQKETPKNFFQKVKTFLTREI